MNIKNVLSPTQRSSRSSSWPDVEPWAHAPVSLHSRGQTHLTVGRKKKEESNHVCSPVLSSVLQAVTTLVQPELS